MDVAFENIKLCNLIVLDGEQLPYVLRTVGLSKHACCCIYWYYAPVV